MPVVTWLGSLAAHVGERHVYDPLEHISPGRQLNFLKSRHPRSGKSTVVGLIERFYDAASGAVLLDGMDIRQYNLRHLRSQVQGSGLY